MRPVRAHVTISAPREEVYDFVADLANRVAWCDHWQKEFRLTRPRAYGEGAAARFRAEAPFNTTWAEATIVKADRPRVLREQLRLGRLGRTPGYAQYDFEPVGTATRVEFAIWTEPATRLDAFKETLGTHRWLKRQVKKSLNRLRAIFEERPADEPLPRATIAGFEPSKAARFGSV